MFRYYQCFVRHSVLPALESIVFVLHVAHHAGGYTRSKRTLFIRYLHASSLCTDVDYLWFRDVLPYKLKDLGLGL